MSLILYISLLCLFNAFNALKAIQDCPKHSILSVSGLCVSLDFLQSSSKPLCINSQGWMNQGGCQGQCYNPFKYPIKCLNKDSNTGIGICKIKNAKSNSWKTCCPIGHTLSTNDECISQFKYHNGSIIRNRVLDTEIVALYLGNWSRQDKRVIYTFLNHLEESKWMNALKQYYMTTSNGDKVYATHGFRKTISEVSLVKTLHEIMNRPFLETLILKFIHKKFDKRVEKSIYVVFLDENMSFVGYCQELCGYHSYLRYRDDVYKYIVIGHPNSVGVGKCNQCMHPSLESPQSNSPNGKILDSILYQLSYFLAETVTDPFFNGWNAPISHTSSDQTIGISGMCLNRYYESLLKENNTNPNSIVYYNTRLHGKSFLLHEIWDYNRGQCTTGLNSPV